MRPLYYILLLFSLAGCSRKSSDAQTQPPSVDPPVAGKTDFDKAYQLSLTHPLQDKNFYALSMMQRLNEVRMALRSNPYFKVVTDRKIAQFKQALGCDFAPCMVSLMKFTDAEKDSIGNVLASLASEASVQLLIRSHLRPSGMFEKYADLKDDRFIRQVWLDATSSINHIMDVYANGVTARYPTKDNPKYNPTDPSFAAQLRTSLQTVADTLQSPLFFEPSLAFSLATLVINNRDEAGRFEPLTQGENRDALEYLSTVDWEKYAYAAIVLLGDSPNSPGDAPNISKSAINRIALAVENYKARLAPVIIITGANVYPSGTPYHEAIEMKKYLLANHPEVPAKAIIVDPHARHTTTNLRNSVRLVFRYGVPSNKKLLVTAIASQLDTIQSAKFASRCMEEMGIMPVKILSRYSSTNLEVLPEKLSLQVNAIDPLDP